MALVEYIRVFLVGGLLCVIAQILIDKSAMTGARILVTYVIAGVFLTGIGWYDKVVDFAKAGATVPIIGFGYTLASGTKEAIDQQGLIGILTGGLTGTAAGLTAAIVFAFIWSLIFKSKQK